MKITNSSIAMASTHDETSFTYKESMTIEAAKSKDVAGAILTLSAEGTRKNLKESMVEYKKQQEEEAKQRRQENEARSLQQMAEQMKTQKTDNQFEISDEYDMKIKMLKQILAALRGEKVPEDCKNKPQKKGGVLDLRTAELNKIEGVSFDLSAKSSVSLGSIEIGTNASGTTWQKITATSGFASESESTTFASTGIVQTADGRSIDFNVEVSMSRAFMCQIDTLEVQDYIKTDPLMINLDTNIGSVSNQKFFFDLDSDGKEEKISFAANGFKDLAAYDEDGNGWIDENDSVFSKLKVWTKDENGNDYLIDLKKADVGAIYLSNADTQFSLKDDENNLNAEIKKTGIYLRESTGAVGTLNHVDLVI